MLGKTRKCFHCQIKNRLLFMTIEIICISNSQLVSLIHFIFTIYKEYSKHFWDRFKLSSHLLLSNDNKNPNIKWIKFHNPYKPIVMCTGKVQFMVRKHILLGNECPYYLPFFNDVVSWLSTIGPKVKCTNVEFPSSWGTTEIANVNTKNIQIFIFTPTLLATHDNTQSEDALCCKEVCIYLISSPRAQNRLNF